MNLRHTNFRVMFYLLFIGLNIFSNNSLSSETLKKDSLVLHGGYAFSTFSGQKTVAVYLSIFNNSKNDVIIAKVKTDISNSSHIHETKKDGDIVKMRMLENVKIRKGESLFLQPGGKHIMMMGLTKPLRSGDSFSLNLITDNNDIIKTNIMILDRVMKN